MRGRAWQKAWTAPAVLGEKRAFETNSTPDVPSDRKAEPGVTAPMPQAEAALSPPPPAMSGARAMPQRARNSSRSRPVPSLPS